jgi:hypothetical protein
MTIVQILLSIVFRKADFESFFVTQVHIRPGTDMNYPTKIPGNIKKQLKSQVQVVYASLKVLMSFMTLVAVVVSDNFFGENTQR